MKILHVISQRPEQTGSGIYLRAILKEVQQVGYPSFLVAGVPRGEYPALETLSAENCSYVEFEGRELPFPVVGMSDTMPYRSYRFSQMTAGELVQYKAAFTTALTAAVEHFQPDVIHCHHLWIVTALTRELFPQIPVVASCHGTALRQQALCAHLSDTVVEFCQQLDHVFALGHVQADMIREKYGIAPDRIDIVGGGYNQGLFYPGQRSATDEIEILYAGKLSASKGVPLLLKALARIKHLPWRLDLAGSSGGPEYELCQELAEKLDGKARFHGMVDQGVLSNLMRKSHIFVLPSFYEGLPLVLLEALACGCRIVSTMLPGTAEIFRDIDSENLTLLPLPELETVDQPFAEDEKQLVQDLADALEKQIKSALKDPGIDLAPFDPILKHYTWSEVFNRIDAVYQRV